MQEPVTAYLDGLFLIRVTISQTCECRTFHQNNFHLEDESGNNIEIASLRTKQRNLYLTGEFFNWELNKNAKLHWDSKDQYYYYELPLNYVKGKEFKFVENGYIWYPGSHNLKVSGKNTSPFEIGYRIDGKIVRFILKHNYLGFHNIQLELHSSAPLTPDKQYYLIFRKQERFILKNRDIFDRKEFFYNEADLGFSWSPQRTVFKIWSPVADEMKVVVFKNSTDLKPISVIKMNREEKGVWFAEISGNWENYYYLYRIRLDQKEFDQIDPYSRGLSVNSTRSLIFDKWKTDPQGWDKQRILHLDSGSEAVIYELHIRDFTISPDWQGPSELRGKYLGLCRSGFLKKENQKIIWGLDHLRDLGINVIQLLPVFDFNTVDETGADRTKLRNWGYDPYAYNVPEGSYALHPDDHRRITEFKEMIMTLHNEGFKVIMDVVYNHTANTGAPFSVFDTFMPEYFYRLTRAGEYANGSGCGNEIASEKKMVRKYIIDSLKYWVQEYKIDGFRFDLMGLIDIDTMKEAAKELRKLKQDILIYGEPWAGGASPLKNPTLKGSQKNEGFAVFNDDFRDSLRGDTDGIKKGWVMGDFSLKQQVISGLSGSIDTFAAHPTESINYISAHDNYTWYDKLLRSTPEVSRDSRMKMAKLGLAIVITSQGVPFLHAGSEFLRTKRTTGAAEEDIRNSYKADDNINQLDWTRKAQYYDFFSYIKRLLEIRKKYPALRMTSKADIKDRFSLLNKKLPDSVIAYMIKGNNITTDLIIIHNAAENSCFIELPPGLWRLIFDNKFELRKTQGMHIDGNITVESLSTTILELD